MSNLTISVAGGVYDVEHSQRDPIAGDTLVIWCQGCRRTFTWEVPENAFYPPHYHSKSCQERTRVRRKNQSPRRCPNPDKKHYRTPEEAEEGFRQHTAKHGFGAQPYHCRCGWYHLGNVSWVIVNV